MQYKLVRHNDEYYLLEETGKAHTLALEEVSKCILNFDTFNSSDLNSPIGERPFEDPLYITLISFTNATLTVSNASFLREIFFDVTAFDTVQEYATKHCKERTIVARLCRDGRIPGAIRKGPKWYIPKDAPYPQDCRAGRDMSKRYAHKRQKEE